MGLIEANNVGSVNAAYLCGEISLEDKRKHEEFCASIDEVLHHPACATGSVTKLETSASLAGSALESMAAASGPSASSTPWNMSISMPGVCWRG